MPSYWPYRPVRSARSNAWRRGSSRRGLTGPVAPPQALANASRHGGGAAPDPRPSTQTVGGGVCAGCWRSRSSPTMKVDCSCTRGRRPRRCARDAVSRAGRALRQRISCRCTPVLISAALAHVESLPPMFGRTGDDHAPGRPGAGTLGSGGSLRTMFHHRVAALNVDARARRPAQVRSERARRRASARLVKHVQLGHRRGSLLRARQARGEVVEQALMAARSASGTLARRQPLVFETPEFLGDITRRPDRLPPR